jgi:hypothetical protein
MTLVRFEICVSRIQVQSVTAAPSLSVIQVTAKSSSTCGNRIDYVIAYPEVSMISLLEFVSLHVAECVQGSTILFNKYSSRTCCIVCNDARRLLTVTKEGKGYLSCSIPGLHVRESDNPVEIGIRWNRDKDEEPTAVFLHFHALCCS